MKIDQLISELLDARKAIGNAEVVIYDCVTSKGFEIEATNSYESTMENPDGEIDLFFIPREIPLVDRANDGVCNTCPIKHTCYEYQSNGISDKAYYEWTLKAEKCDQEDEFHARANRLAEPVYLKGVDY